MPTSPLWLVDWLDGEHEDFSWAWEKAGLEVEVERAAPLGPTVGTSRHRLRSWPAYASLALKGLARGRDRPVVAWQALAGALVGLGRVRRRPGRLVVLNPILAREGSALQSVTTRGLHRADRILFYTRPGLELAAERGLDRSKLHFVPLGVRPRADEAPPPSADGYLLAVGRDSRDWPTLIEASEGLGHEILVMGPRTLPGGQGGALRLAPSGVDFFSLLSGAIGIVLPFSRTDRPIGHISMLSAMSVGRAVIATRIEGDEDYLAEDYSIRVPVKDPQALRLALERVLDLDVATRMGSAALEAARTSYSLERFVRDVDAEARGTSSS